MSELGIDLTTPVGRIVWGHPGKATNKKHQDGPNKGQNVIGQDGQPVMQWNFGVAFDKAVFQQTIWPAMAQEAATGYPNGVPPRFAWKYQDGDGIDSKGQPFNLREGYPGCIVLSISTQFQAPPIFKLENGAYRQLDPKEIKCGDYVAVGLNIKVNVATGTNTPSLYINPRAVELVGYGAEIVGSGGADPNALFGGVQHALPPGASAAPVATAGAPVMPGMGAAPPMAAPGGLPGMPGAPMAAPLPVPVPTPPPPAPVGPQRPVDPSHIHDNGNGTEQWFINGAWDGGAHPVAPAAPALPPPATNFIPGAPAAPAPMAMPGMMPPR